MKVKHDIQNTEDIKLMVDSFYGAVKEDELLSPIFCERIKDDWQPHLEKMYRFWSAALLGIPGYRGAPFPPHAAMQLEQRHFDRWLQLFGQTLEEHFSGPLANEAKERAALMAKLFVHKLEMLSPGKLIPLV